MAPTAPTTNGQFSFNVDSFDVESSGHHLHRRATTAELKAVFDTSAKTNKTDHVGHWYEAQLLHYGLAPSKNKAVAKNRLLNALRGDSLAVPKEILKVETDLKTDWKKKDKQSRSAALATQKPATAEKPKSAPKAAPKTAPKASAKANTKAAPAKIASATTTPTTTSTSAAAKRKREEDATGAASKTPAKKQATKQTAKRGGSTAKARSYEEEVAAATKPPARKQSATRGQGGSRGGSSATGRSQPTVPEPEPTRPPRTKQTALRSRAFYPYAGTARPLLPQEPPPYDSIYGRVNTTHAITASSYAEETFRTKETAPNTTR
ncbi:hypothetical protein N7520_001474 [Penicillium odoratum]|uniref:uncharacterized protein n=1 Tax=Penicillium odoratum TaxID=1167516 RepID=UPI0025498D3E|nr:uncharacterized protein N7520_001474 [Penicillium odoratum]KAJ5778228.1 hypothetical protein N7520_001474 [Penicillium odoratum]